MSADDDPDRDADGSTDGGYVHTPEREAGAPSESGSEGESIGADRGPSESDGTELETDGFGRKGWALTGVLFTCVLVIPGIIYAYPYAAGAFGFTFFATYLALPLIPAVLLGLVAVWSMTAAVRDQ
ncbi:hypothetical protein [Halorubrum sp. DTA46]|uniref:hypothetical protein n=1 Tax=Halorubrum sp. DTA46 TaxID=3402162 RepID=UPI003AAD6043